MKRWFLSVAAVLCFLTACGALPISTTPQGRHILEGVPFYPDDTDQCGPSALASVLGYWGVPTEPAELKKDLYLAKADGTLPMDMAPVARAHGFAALAYSGDLDQLRAAIEEGSPLVVCLNLGLKALPYNHFAVVTGFDDVRQGVYLHSGKKKNTFVSYKKFLKSWDKTDRWTLKVSR